MEKDNGGELVALNVKWISGYVLCEGESDGRSW